MIAKGVDNLSKIYLGSTEVSKAYLGTDQIYPNEVASATSDLTFTTNTLLTNTAQVFTPTSGANFGHTGLDTLFLAANENGRIYAKLQASDADYFILGFNTANAETGYAGMEIAAYIDNTGLVTRTLSGALYSTGVTLSVGQYIGLYRVGATFKIQYSNDAITWVDIGEAMYGLTFSSSAALYIVCDLYSAGQAKMYYPKVTHYDTGNLANIFIQDGDSLGAGVTTPGNFTAFNIGYKGWASLDGVTDNFYKNISVSGNGIGSRTAALGTAQFPLYGQVGNSFTKIIVAINCGVNDIQGGSSAATVYNLMMTYVNDVLNQDARTKVMVYTVCNCDPAYASNSVRLAYNALLMGTTQTARFKIVDVSGTAALNDATAYLDGTYYQADGLHLKEAGYDLLYDLAEPVLLSF